jgi:nucleotide-binding universal stress UspA family protein
MRVVLGVDGSKYSDWATGWLAKMPFRSAPTVIAVHGVDLHALRAPFMVQPTIAGNERFIEEEVRRLEKRAKTTVADTKQRMADLALSGSARIERGPIARMLLKHARPGALVVVGSRGLDAMDRFMLGSISTYVTLHAPCSVLIVKEPAQTLRRILFATDGSSSSRKALGFLTTHFQVKPGTDPIAILLVHVMPFLRYPEIKEAGQRLLDHEAKRLERAGYRVTEYARLGRPAEEILKVARREKPDLIVTGAKGLGAVARFLLGSVSIKLVQQSSHSVLVVR